MSGCQCNKTGKQAGTELLLPNNLSRNASQITNRVVVDNKQRVRAGVGAPPVAHHLSAFEALGISTDCKAFPDYNPVKQVRACFEILPGANDDSTCVRCPSPAPEPCGFPLPSPSPCCQPKQTCCGGCQCPPPPPPPPCDHKCKPCECLKKLQFVDPCDEKKCKWTIKPDECGKNVLVFQYDGKDVAILDSNGNFILLGSEEATKYCLAPLEDCLEKQWCFKTNPTSKALQFDCEDRNQPLEGDATTSKTILFTKSGSIVESTSNVTFDNSINCFLFNTDNLPATIFALNPSLLTSKSVKLSAGAFNGQTVKIVNVYSVAISVDLNGNVKTLAGETVMVAVWSSAANRWTTT